MENRQRTVVENCYLLLDEGGDHHHPATSQEHRSQVEAAGNNEDEQDSTRNARQRQWNGHMPECPSWVAPSPWAACSTEGLMAASDAYNGNTMYGRRHGQGR